MNLQRLATAVLVLQAVACTGTLDAGRDRQHGLLPVDERNPMLLCNDGPTDNWQGEYAILFSKFGGPKLVGLIINQSPAWTDLDVNVAGWVEMIAAARSSGIAELPEPTASSSEFMIRPADGLIDSTPPNDSVGARLILATAKEYAEASRPLVVVTGGRLTDVADAYLLDPSISERIVVVSSLGTTTDTGAIMGSPNGEMDYWADIIVSSRLRYVQVSSFYGQSADVPDARLAELPKNDFGAWIATKQPKVLERIVAADQVSVLAAAAAQFVTGVDRVAQANRDGAELQLPPPLAYDASGKASLVTAIDASLPSQLLWSMLAEM